MRPSPKGDAGLHQLQTPVTLHNPYLFTLSKLHVVCMHGYARAEVHIFSYLNTLRPRSFVQGCLSNLSTRSICESSSRMHVANHMAASRHTQAFSDSWAPPLAFSLATCSRNFFESSVRPCNSSNRNAKNGCV